MESEKTNNKRSKLKDFFFKPVVNINPSFIQYSGLGIQLAATIIVFLFIGIWARRKVRLQIHIYARFYASRFRRRDFETYRRDKRTRQKK